MLLPIILIVVASIVSGLLQSWLEKHDPEAYERFKAEQERKEMLREQQKIHLTSDELQREIDRIERARDNYRSRNKGECNVKS